MIHIAGRTYEMIADHKNGWRPEAFRDRYSEVLERYDYIVGDWGYSQLRLRGFFKDNHPKATRDTTISTLHDYLNEYCNFGCAYFIIEKVPNKQGQDHPDQQQSTDDDIFLDADLREDQPERQHSSAYTYGKTQKQPQPDLVSQEKGNVNGQQPGQGQAQGQASQGADGQGQQGQHQQGPSQQGNPNRSHGNKHRRPNLGQSNKNSASNGASGRNNKQHSNQGSGKPKPSSPSSIEA